MAAFASDSAENEVIPATAVVLAGGLSTRFSTDKALLPIHGKPMVQYVAEIVGSAFAHVLIVTNSEETRSALADYHVITDLIPHQGPISGLHAALKVLPTEWAFVVGCDMPFVNVALARYMFSLRQGYDVVVPRNGELYETLHALYATRCAPLIEDQMRRGRRRLVSFFGEARVCEVSASTCRVFDPELRMFYNVNTPAEFASLLQTLEGGRVMSGKGSIKLG